MAQNQRYNGLPLEDPLDHLDQFERLCRTVKMNGVPENAIKMILFPFSLGNKASQWEKNVPSELVSTWDDVKKEFITKFYPKQKTAKLRNDINSFKQGVHENFYEAWERLKDYTRECPHHGVLKENLLGIFYRGALEQYRRALDTASYGCFYNLTAEQGELLIENLAQSEACYGGDYDRGVPDQSQDSRQQIKELNEKIEKLSRVFLVNQKAVNFVREAEAEQQRYSEATCDGFQGVQGEVNYVGNQNNYQGGFQNRPYNQGYGNNNLSYRSNNVENPQDQYYPPRAPQGNSYQPRPSGGSPQSYNAPWKSQGVQNPAPPVGYQGEQKYRPPQQRQDGYHVAQSAGRDDIRNVMKQLMEGQVKAQAQLTEKLEKFERKIDSNHAESQAKFADIYSHLKTLDNQIAQVASTSKRPMGTFSGKPDTNPKEYVNSIDVMMVDADENSEEDEDDTKEVATDIVDAKLPTATNETATIPPEYQPKLPFPGRFKKQMLARHEALLEQLLSKITFTLPLIESFLRHPNFPESVKKFLREKGKELREAEMATQDQTKIITQQEEDLGQVLNMEEHDALKECGTLEADGKGGQKLHKSIKEYNEPGDLFEEKQGIFYTEAVPIDRSSATDRSVPSLKKQSENAGSIIFGSIDHPPDDITPGASSKRAGKRPTASPTTSLNKKKVKMKSQGRAPPLQEEEGDTQKLIRGKKTLVSSHCLSPI